MVRLTNNGYKAYQNQVCTFHRDIGAAANRDSDIGLAESCHDLEISGVDFVGHTKSLTRCIIDPIT
jgi:hypothetical protein